MPGAGGTQRLPRLVGIPAALPILLEGGRLSGQAAVDAGLVHALVPAGEEVAAAEAWLLTRAEASQPWDRDDWLDPGPASVAAAIDPVRARVMAETEGYYPAPIAILDCIEFGLPQCFDGAIRSEMAIFAHLIQRPEPRNMIQTLFLGKTDYDRHARKETLPAFIDEVVAALVPLKGGWNDAEARVRAEDLVARWADGHGEEELRMADYAVVSQLGYPAYLGGPFASRRAAST